MNLSRLKRRFPTRSKQPLVIIMTLKFLILMHRPLKKKLNSFFMYEEDPTSNLSWVSIRFSISSPQKKFGCQLGYQYFFNNNCWLCINKKRFSNTQLLNTS